MEFFGANLVSSIILDSTLVLEESFHIEELSPPLVVLAHERTLSENALCILPPILDNIPLVTLVPLLLPEFTTLTSPVQEEVDDDVEEQVEEDDDADNSLCLTHDELEVEEFFVLDGCECR